MLARESLKCFQVQSRESLPILSQPVVVATLEQTVRVGQGAAQIVEHLAQVRVCLLVCRIGPQHEREMLTRQRRITVNQQVGEQRLCPGGLKWRQLPVSEHKIHRPEQPRAQSLHRPILQHAYDHGGVTDRPVLLTVGHGTHAENEFASLLRSAGIAALVDVRIAPGSRRFPQFGRAALEGWLPASGISYFWERRLGGFRKLPANSPDVALRNTSFRAYAAHMRTPEFAAAMAEIVTRAAAEPTALMCSESVWWRCHRRLIADNACLIRQLEVWHIMPDGRLDHHELTAGVRVSGTELVYDKQSAPGPHPAGRVDSPDIRS
jgi:uncharacterized protein DUF488